MEPFSLMKFFDFSLPTMGKVISIGIKLLVAVALIWAVYVAFIKPWVKPLPTQSTTQKADEICNYNYTPKVMFGCIRFGMEKKNEQPKPDSVH